MSREVAKRNMTIMAITWAMMGPFSAATRVYSSLYFLELGAGAAEVGLISMAGLVTLGFSRLIGGYLADAVGRKRIIVPMTMVYGVASVLYAVARDWTWILAASVLSSLALLYQPAIQAILADTLPPEVRGRGLSLANMVSQLASLAGPPLATLLVARMPLARAMRILYAANAAAIFGAGIVRLGFVETLEERVRPNFRDALRGYVSAVRELRGDLGKLILVSSLAPAFYQMAFPFVQIYAVRELGVSEEFWGLISTVVSVESVASMLASGYLTDRIGRNLTLALGYGSGSLGLAILALAPPGEPYLVLLSQVVATAFASWPASFALMADLTPTRLRGKIMAIRGMIQGNLSGLGSGLGGALYEVSPALPIAAAAAGLVPLVVISAKWLPAGAIENGKGS